MLKLKINHLRIMQILDGFTELKSEKLISLNPHLSVGIQTRHRLAWSLKTCLERLELVSPM